MRQEFTITMKRRNRRGGMRGATLTMAILWVAEGNLTDEEIASELHVSPESLAKAKQKPFFARRVAEEQAKLERVVGKA